MEATFVPLKQFHVERLEPRVQASQRLFKLSLTPEAIAAMVAGPAQALLVDGEPVAAAGLIDEKEGRARAWALIGERDLSPALWGQIVAAMRAGIEQALHPQTGWAQRVYAETVYDWREGHRLLLHLGLSFEGMNRGAFPGGRHGVTYARVRSDVPPLPVRCSATMRIVERCLWEDAMNADVPYAARREAA
jgi:hypothetical protein